MCVCIIPPWIIVDGICIVGVYVPDFVIVVVCALLCVVPVVLCFGWFCCCVFDCSCCCGYLCCYGECLCVSVVECSYVPYSCGGVVVFLLLVCLMVYVSPVGSLSVIFTSGCCVWSVVGCCYGVGYVLFSLVRVYVFCVCVYLLCLLLGGAVSGHVALLFVVFVSYWSTCY